MDKLKDFFLKDKFIFTIIIINSILLFIQESGVNSRIVTALDAACTIVFMIEMGVKLRLCARHGVPVCGICAALLLPRPLQMH